jgi:hypothetical protein
VAISTIDSLRNALGLNQQAGSGLQGQQGSLYNQLGQNLQNAVGVTQEGLEDNAYRNYPRESFPRQYQDQYWEKEIALKQKQFELQMQAVYQKSAFEKGAVKKEALSSFAFTEPLSVVRNLWCAADLGGKWVDPNVLDDSQKLMFERLRRNNMFEIVEVADDKAMVVLTFYRLKE